MVFLVHNLVGVGDMDGRLVTRMNDMSESGGSLSAGRLGRV